MNPAAPANALAGKTFFWVGSTDGGRSLLTALKSNGAKIVRCASMIVTPPRDPRVFATEMKQIDTYDWVLFTSRQAAQTVRGLPRPRGRIAAVGPGTAAQLRSQGWKVHLVPDRQDAQGLAQALLQLTQTSGCVLFLRGNRANETLALTLRQSGFLVREIEAYATEPVSTIAARAIVHKIIHRADAVIVGSPLSLGVLVEGAPPGNLPRLKPGLRWLCLGKATQKALADVGLAVEIPASLTPADFLAYTTRSLQEKNRSL